MSYRIESAELALRDAEQMKELSAALSDYHYRVMNDGQDGLKEVEKARELARQAIKTLVNYL